MAGNERWVSAIRVQWFGDEHVAILNGVPESNDVAAPVEHYEIFGEGSAFVEANARLEAGLVYAGRALGPPFESVLVIGCSVRQAVGRD